MAIDWREGYSCEWRVYRVDRETWADAELVPDVTSVRVERSCEDDAPLLESGEMTVAAEVGETFQEGYYRVAMVASQGGYRERVDVCTLLCAATGGEVSLGGDVSSVRCRSVLWPASRRVLELGSYVPAGSDGVAWVASLLRSAVNAPVESEGSFTLDAALVFDNGTSALEAAWQVLGAGGYVMQVAGDGTVRVMPRPEVPALELDAANARLMHDGVRHDRDLSEVPNRYIATDGADEAMAVNDDPASVTSTASRGWACDVRDDSPTRVNGETLQAYAERRLEEESTVYDVRQYTREWWPGVYPHSLVRGSLPSVTLDGDLRVSRQTLTCGAGIVVEEESRMEVRTWQRA